MGLGWPLKIVYIFAKNVCIFLKDVCGVSNMNSRWKRPQITSQGSQNEY